MSASEISRYVRLRVDLVLEVTERGRLTDAALLRIRDDEFMPDDERAHAGAVVREDEAEALAYLVEPSRLIGGVPGVELVQASWTSELAARDPDADAWHLDDDLDDDDLDDDDLDDDGLDNDGLDDVDADDADPDGGPGDGPDDSDGGGGEEGRGGAG
ncbi:hypothetical protein LUW75_07490 [Streptomyces sp. MRC013]|uniref:hypothetical protein n=1 Tax=Streptomyces sp. MRC013 TaxID=2898276 RepID=UPI002026CE3B|nr:hypothetical protein [Streptomyces sp. MRC013]URM89860.1 hypothetical protein LUW75_07490 [Streptomyces sp. MRC013]